MSFVRAGRMGGVLTQQRRAYSTTTAKNFKVAVVGAYGGIGQPLALLTKLNPDVKHLSLYDLNPATPGAGADLSHIPTPAKVSAFSGDELGKCLAGSDIIIIPAGVPRKPGMTRDDLFNTNASIVANIAKTAAEHAPNACHLIISNPVNSTVPIYAEILKRFGKYNKNKLFGVTTLDVLRANTFIAENQKMDPMQVNVPVIGGHAGITIIPLLSNVPYSNYSDKDRDALTQRIMFGGDEVVKAKAGAGSATLSMAWAGAKFAFSVMNGLKGEQNIVECTYVENNIIPEVSYFSSPVLLGKNGIEKILPLPSHNDYEAKLVKAAIPELKSSIEKGIEFAAKWTPK